MDMKKLMKQAKKMQEEIEKTQEELKNYVYTAESGGGAVKVEMSGKKEIKSLKINDELLDPEEKEMLEDLIIIAVNDAIKHIEDKSNKELNKHTKGFGGMF